MPGIIGKKLGMSQVIQDDGRVIPVTFVKCDPNEIVQIKTQEKDGYPAIVLGFDAYKNPSKNIKFKTQKEFRVTNPAEYKKGQILTIETLKGVEKVTVTATSKGKGYQGVVKRYHFAGGPKSHGSHFHREPGSVGCRAKPGKTIKGKRLPGHMGVDTVTIKNRPVVAVEAAQNLVAIKGAIPGAISTYIYIKF